MSGQKQGTKGAKRHKMGVGLEHQMVHKGIFRGERKGGDLSF